MRPIGVAARVVIGLLLAATVTVVAAGNETHAATKYARITIHKAECPANTHRIFTCHENRVAGVAFTVSNPSGRPKTKRTDGNGVVSFGPRAGRISIVEDPAALIGTYRGAYVYCKDQPSGTVLYDGQLHVGGLELDTWRGARIVCDWYNLLPERRIVWGTVVIHKVDAAGVPLPGSCFSWRTFDPPNAPQGAICDGNTGFAPIDPDGLNNGTITWSRVPAGIPVEVWESIAPAGYAAAPSQTVTLAPGETVTLTFVNTAA